jgi:hypothetical protein
MRAEKRMAWVKREEAFIIIIIIIIIDFAGSPVFFSVTDKTALRLDA